MAKLFQFQLRVSMDHRLWCCSYNHWFCPTRTAGSAIETVPNESNSWSESSYRSKIEDPSESDLGEFGAAYFGLLAETF